MWDELEITKVCALCKHWKSVWRWQKNFEKDFMFLFPKIQQHCTTNYWNLVFEGEISEMRCQLMTKMKLIERYEIFEITAALFLSSCFLGHCWLFYLVGFSRTHGRTQKWYINLLWNHAQFDLNYLIFYKRLMLLKLLLPWFLTKSWKSF